MNKKILIGVVAVLVIGGVIVLASEKSGEDKSSKSTANTSSQTSAETNSATTITYTNDGFSPATITVKSGTTVTVKNASSQPLQFESDPHPQHTDNEELNVSNVAPGESQTFVANTTGTFGYHNHLNSSDTGTIVVN